MKNRKGETKVENNTVENLNEAKEKILLCNKIKKRSKKGIEELNGISKTTKNLAIVSRKYTKTMKVIEVRKIARERSICCLPPPDHAPVMYYGFTLRTTQMLITVFIIPIADVNGVILYFASVLLIGVFISLHDHFLSIHSMLNKRAMRKLVCSAYVFSYAYKK